MKSYQGRVTPVNRCAQRSPLKRMRPKSRMSTSSTWAFSGMPQVPLRPSKACAMACAANLCPEPTEACATKTKGASSSLGGRGKVLLCWGCSSISAIIRNYGSKSYCKAQTITGNHKYFQKMVKKALQNLFYFAIISKLSLRRIWRYSLSVRTRPFQG